MKILLLNANRVGIGTYHRAFHFGRELARRGNIVKLMTVSDKSRYRSVTRHDTENFSIVECANWFDELLPWHASGPLDIWSRIRELWGGDYDVVYAFEYQPNISIPVFATRMFRRFTLLSDWCDWHAGASYHFGGHAWAHAVDRYFEELIRHHADYVTTINRTLHERARSIGIAGERLAIVGEGVDPTYIAPLDRDITRRALELPDRVPIVGTIRDSQRATEILCEAVARTQTPDLHLLVIGRDPDRVRDAASRAGVAHRVLAPGRVSDRDLPRYLGAADVLALPLEDNLVNRGRWPHKLGDMIAAQRPVIVSRGGEFPQLLEARGCAHVVDFDAAAFARGIDEVLARHEHFEAMALRGRRLIETELNWDVIGAQLQDVLHQATAGHAAR